MPNVGAVWGSSVDDVYVYGGNPIMRSVDRGKTWDTQRPKLGAQLLFTVRGTGPNDVWIAGEGKLDDHNYYGRPILAQSTDGGKTRKETGAPTTAISGGREGMRSLCFAAGPMFSGNEQGSFMSPSPRRAP